MGEVKTTGPRLKRLKKAPFDIEVKRFYVPAVIFDTCPNCGHHVKMDMTRDPDYLSYPTAGVPFDVTMYCHASPKGEYCGHEWKVKVQLNVSLKLVKEKSNKARIRVCAECYGQDMETNNGEPAGTTITKRGSKTYYCEDCGNDWNEESWAEA